MSNKSVRWAFNFSNWNPSHSELLLATSCIQQEEKERLSKFVFKKDFKSSLIGRLMMRKFVAEATDRKYDEINFVRDEKGKPMLASNDSKVNFNVSHQGDYAVLAGISNDSLLGVDVVKVESRRDKSLNEYFRLMSRTLTATEWERVRNAGSERDQSAMFYRHWCLKESYLKAVGIGVTVDLRDVSFEIGTEILSKHRVVDDTRVYLKGKRSDWVFHEMLLDDEHCVAVASDSKDLTEELFVEVTFGELVKDAVPLLAGDERYCLEFFKKLDK